ncbi:MAG: hypothetical protein HFJ54_03910 [Clostridia bacterium]|nr:hypothetical protein [Clostridia bacterium]
MASCLGLYIEENIIKYAKVSKDNDVIKIDSFGIKFYDKINEAIEQVIAETYSYKTPISINTTNENYNYFYVFNLLNKKDMQNYIKTEFESLCYEKEQNVDVFDTRYVLVNDLEDKEKIKAIHISINKGELSRRTDLLDKYKLTAASPLALNISNLLEVSKEEGGENIAIVNIENKTTVTTIIGQSIYDVYTIEAGTKDILEKIDAKENSYAKAYEICKNSTIYTSEGRELQYEENAYLDDIMPTLYTIVGQVKKILNDSLNKIDKIYISGTASVINNIDIYFQEYLEDVKCEILRPYFIRIVGTEINIKDYIEVNSAIALALQGLGEGLKGTNFKKESMTDKLPAWMTKEVGGKSGKPSNPLFDKVDLKMDFKDALSTAEKALIRGVTGVLLLMITYGAFATVLTNQIRSKVDETATAKQKLQTQVVAVMADKTKLDEKTNEYDMLVKSLEEKSQQASENKRLKDAIPTLLNKIMYVIPVNVQLKSITNTGTKITIVAQSDKYEQLGIFVAKLSQDGILLNVVSDTSQKTNEVVTVTIEGELP